MSDLLRCAVYIRVSSEEQAKFGDSMRDQKERGLEYINSHKNMKLQDIYIDDGISGQKLDRGDFSRLMDAAKKEEIDLIIFTKLDRWFRNLRHYLNTQAILEDHGVAWTAIDQPYFDTSTPHGRAFVAQSMMWAELEAQNDGVRIRDVFKNKVKYGEVITGKVPRGYQIEQKHLIFSEEAPAIYDSIQYFLKCQSMRAAVRYLQDRHHITMSVQNFRQSILKNEKYTGRYRDNTAYCPRLISDADWAGVQRILAQNLNIRSSQTYDYIFSGLLVCRECGYKMCSCQIHVKSVKKSGDIFRYRYPAYTCRQVKTHVNCVNSGEIRESRIEAYLLQNIRPLLENYIAEYENTKSAVIDNRGLKSSLRRKMDKLKELCLNDAITLDEYKTDRKKLEQQLLELPDLIMPDKDPARLKKMLEAGFESIYSGFNNKEKRRFWRGLIKEIRISKSHNRSRTFEIIPL